MSETASEKLQDTSLGVAVIPGSLLRSVSLFSGPCFVE